MDFSNITALKDYQKQKQKEKNKGAKTPDGKRLNPRIHGLIESEILRKPIDIRETTTYEGATKVFLTKVPLRCNSERYDVSAEALREWIIYAVIEEDPQAQILFEKIQSLTETIDEIEENLKKIPKLQFMDELGEPLNEEKAREQRDRLFEKYGADRVVIENQLEDVEQELKRNVVRRRNLGVELIQGAIDYTFNTSTWSMRLHGSDDVDEIEDLLMQKMNWAGIKLALGDDRRNPPMPPWAGRGDVPDGSTLAMPDYTHLTVNMLGVRIMRLPAGVGLAKNLDRKSSTLSSEAFGMYYGEFDQGILIQIIAQSSKLSKFL